METKEKLHTAFAYCCGYQLDPVKGCVICDPQPERYKRLPLDHWPYGEEKYGMPTYDDVRGAICLAPSKEELAHKIAHMFDDGVRGAIDRGELMVMKTARIGEWEGVPNCCSNCGHWIGDGPNFCPGCGAKIIE